MMKLGFSVCPHDTAKNLTGWFILNTYLQRKLERPIHFEPRENFHLEREEVLKGGAQIVYANPYSACAYRKALGFVPLARPVGVFDEAVLLSQAGGAGDGGIPVRRPLRIASATDKLIVHALGLTLLEAAGIGEPEREIVFVGTHLKAAQLVRSGQADLGFVFNETWAGLADSTKADLVVVAETRRREAYHCFCAAPELADQHGALQAIFCEMKDDPKGRGILDELKFAAFEPVPPTALDGLRTHLAALRA